MSNARLSRDEAWTGSAREEWHYERLDVLLVGWNRLIIVVSLCSRLV